MKKVLLLKPIGFTLLLLLSILSIFAFKAGDILPVNALSFYEETLTYYEVSEEANERLSEVEKAGLNQTATRKFVEVTNDGSGSTITETMMSPTLVKEDESRIYPEEIVKTVTRSNGEIETTDRANQTQTYQEEGFNESYSALIINELIGNEKDYEQQLESLKTIGASFEEVKDGLLQATYQDKDKTEVILLLDPKMKRLVAEKYTKDNEVIFQSTFSYDENNVLKMKTSKYKTVVPNTDVPAQFVQVTIYSNVKN
jgi:hypothetical protein